MSALAGVAATLLAAAVQAPDAPRLARVETLEVAEALAGERVADLDGDGRGELLLVLRDGRVRRHLAIAGGSLLGLAGELRVEDPTRALVDVARLDPARPDAQVLVATPRGTLAWSLAEDGAWESEPAVLAARARFVLRTGEPRLAPIAQDVNRDGRVDLVLPTADACELWIDQGPREADAGAGAGARTLPRLRRTARVPVEVDRSTQHEQVQLDDVLSSSFSIPDLRTRDVNGDGRPDLLVVDGSRRSFHLQAADGSFPEAPSVEVDLKLFRDTTAAGGVAPGRVLAVDGVATFDSRDLDGDGIPDYVIAHRRKVWVFRGSTAGPQFTQPQTILKTVEDVTALTLADLDEDGRADLVLFKVQVPTIATLLRGLFGDWDVDIGAMGYLNRGEAGFETAPSRRSDLVVRLPAIVGLLKDPGALLERFEALRRRFRIVRSSDLDGDGREDLALVSQDGARLECWLAPASTSAAVDTDRALREVFFGGGDQVWDLDRILLWLGGVADRQVAVRTGGRPPAVALDLRDEEGLRLAALEAADLDGDGRAELLVEYRPADGRGRSLVDVLRLVE